MKIIIGIISIVIFLSGAFLFYWFQVRPIEVRKECAKLSDDIRFAQSQSIEMTNENIRRIEQTGINEYQFCMHRKGY